MKKLVVALVVIGVAWRVYAAIHFQGRAWIDEVSVVLNPAYKLATGELHTPWGPVFPGEPREDTIRSWIPPALLALFLKLLALLGVRSGTVVVPTVRLAIALSTIGGLLVYLRALGARARLSTPWLPALVLFFTPELVHYAPTADLSSLGMGLLAAGIGLAILECSTAAGILLASSALFRFQYAVFAVVWLGWLCFKRRWREAALVAGAGALLVALDFAFNSWAYGHASLPMVAYFLNNTVGGLAASYGTTPFYQAFELLWRFTTEPMFLVIILTSVAALRLFGPMAASGFLFFAIHCAVGHKEYRFFYGVAVPLAGIAAATLQRWLEDRREPARLTLTTLFLVALLGVGTWRGLKKTGWHDLEIPNKLETWVGTQPDARGLLVYGWNGIYYGGKYTLHRDIPEVFSPSREELKGRLPARTGAADFNYVIAGSTSASPCRESVKGEGGATVYRCETAEIAALLH